MSAQDGPSTETKICSNCRYISFSSGHGLRCADPASSRFDRPVGAKETCGRFRLSFAAAKTLAFRQPDRARATGWEATMHQHLATRAKDHMQPN